MASQSVFIALSISVMLSHSLVSAAGNTCFFPNGAIHDLGSPCDPDADVSFCCEGTHTCMSNKVCWDTQNNHIIRGSCTDSSFPNSCGNFCLTKSDGSLSNSIADMRQCNGQNRDWVCDMDVTNCAESFELPFGFVQDYRLAPTNNILADGPASSGSAAATAATSVLTVTVTPSASSASSSQTAGSSQGNTTAAGGTINSEAKCNTGFNTAALGAGLGVGLPLLLLLLVCGWFLLRARKVIREMKTGQQPHTHDVPRQEMQPPYAPMNMDHGSHQSMSMRKDTPNPPYTEAPVHSPTSRHELDGVTRR